MSQQRRNQLQPGQPIIEVRELSKSFKVARGTKSAELRALSQASFALHPGKAVSLVGESGSGKSTILRLIIRLLAPSGGQILFRGEDVLLTEPKRASLSYRSQVQMIFQDPFGSLNPVHSIGHHLERPLLRHGKVKHKPELQRRVHELLTTVGLNPAAEFAKKYPHQVSGGQRQRVAIARALAVDPLVLLADEPISMLDVSIRMGVLNLLDRLKKERNIAYLYVTHDIASARYIGDETMVMYAGHIVESAPSDELMANPAHPYTRLLLEAVPNPELSVKRPLSAKSGAPALIDPPPGCPFADRCPNVMDDCRRTLPRVRYVSPGHAVRCHLYPEGTTFSASAAEETTTDTLRSIAPGTK